MKTSTPAQPKLPSPMSILLIGPPGGGKSTLAMQFPNVLIMDCDENLDGPELINRKLTPSLSWSYESIRTDDSGKPLPVETCYDRLVTALSTAANYSQIKTIAVDGLTHVNEFIIRKVLSEQGNKQVMEPHYWTPFKSKTYNLLVAKLRGAGKTTICTCHESILTEIDDKKIGKETIIGYRPAYQGAIVDYFGGFFTDMWRCYSQGAPGNKQEFVLTVSRTAKSDFLKNSLGLSGEIVIKSGERMFDKIASAMKGRI